MSLPMYELQESARCWLYEWPWELGWRASWVWRKWEVWGFNAHGKLVIHSGFRAFGIRFDSWEVQA